MNHEKSSLIGGLDPAELFSLGAGEAGIPEWEPPDLAEAAHLFPRWEIRSLLGRGGMGAVYLARQPELDRDVAVKILPLEACSNEAAVERFRREARTLAKLQHPGIVMLHETGVTPAGHVYFVMEHVDGSPLSEWLSAGKMDVPRAVDIVRQVCDALAYAHGCGVIHRDIKPSNILIDNDGRVKLADFGLARWDDGRGDDGMELSRTGMFMGTPAYTAPEQARDSSRVDHRADLYSLGVLLYEMLTGEVPRGVFQSPSSKVGSDERLDEVVRRALQERPEDRYQEASQIKRDVGAMDRAKSVFHQAGIWTGATAALVILCAAGWYFLPKRTNDAPQAVSPPPSVAPTTPAKKAEPTSTATPPPVIPRPDANDVASRSIIPKNPAASRVGENADANGPPPPPAANVVSKNDPPPNPVTPSLPIGRGVRVWSLDALDPALRPPDTLTRADWRDAVLLADGGAVILTDGSLAVWSAEAPGKFRSVLPGRTWLSLAAVADRVLALASDGNLYRISTSTVEPVLVKKGVKNIYPSAKPGVVLYTDASDTLKFSELSDAASERSIPATPAVRDATIAADGRIWLADADGRLWSCGPENGATLEPGEGKDIIRVLATGDGVVSLSKDGVLTGHRGASVPKGIKDVREIATAGGIALALSANGSAAVWGAPVEDGLQRFRFDADTRHGRIGPSGLVVSW